MADNTEGGNRGGWRGEEEEEEDEGDEHEKEVEEKEEEGLRRKGRGVSEGTEGYNQRTLTNGSGENYKLIYHIK